MLQEVGLLIIDTVQSRSSGCGLLSSVMLCTQSVNTRNVLQLIQNDTDFLSCEKFSKHY